MDVSKSGSRHACLFAETGSCQVCSYAHNECSRDILHIALSALDTSW